MVYTASGPNQAIRNLFFVLTGLAHGWSGSMLAEAGCKMSQLLVPMEVQSETEAQANGVLQNQGTGRTNSS